MNTLCLATIAAMLAAPATATDLDALRWRSRLLVVVAPDPRDDRLRAQKRLFDQVRSGARERDLVWIEGSGDSAQAKDLRRRFGIGPDEFRSILVGKDGGAKLSASQPIPMEQLFDEVDGMPMRRNEMRRNISGGRR